MLDATNSLLIYGHLSFSDGAEPAFVQEFEFRGTRVGIFEQKGLSMEVALEGSQAKVRLPLADKTVFGVRIAVPESPETIEKLERLSFNLEGYRNLVMEAVPLVRGSANLGNVVLERA